MQSVALAAPVLVLPALLYRRTFSVKRFLRYTSLSTFLGGTVFGVGAAYAKLSMLKDDELVRGMADRAERIETDVLQTRCDDYSKIGAVLGGVSFPATG